MIYKQFLGWLLITGALVGIFLIMVDAMGVAEAAKSFFFTFTFAVVIVAGVLLVVSKQKDDEHPKADGN
jgi:high-affinity Fe2+/Pb2+ permease